MELLSNQMREVLADTQHEIWLHWMRYLFSVSNFNENGTVTIPADFVSRWKEQILTDYCDLSGWEKDRAKDQASKVLEAMARASGLTKV